MSVRLAVVVSNFGAAVHGFGSVETSAKVFDLPPEVAEYIAAQMTMGNQTVSLAIEGDPK